jgi:uncharacterized protein (TIGR02271 family)
MITQNELSNGMTVRSADGDKLGKIVAIDNQGFQVEKGIFFPKEYKATFDQVDQVYNGDLYLKWGTHLVEEQYDSFYGLGSYRSETSDEGLWSDYNSRSSYFNRRKDQDVEQSIPVREEELRVERKGMQEKGRIRISKTVRTEDQHFTVPVTREEVHIERVPGSESTYGDSGSMELKDDEITIPIREEEVEITKRPRVKEEIRVSKESKQVGQDVRGTVKKEDVHIDRSDEGSLHP